VARQARRQAQLFPRSPRGSALAPCELAVFSPPAVSTGAVVGASALELGESICHAQIQAPPAASQPVAQDAGAKGGLKLACGACKAEARRLSRRGRARGPPASAPTRRLCWPAHVDMQRRARGTPSLHHHGRSLSSGQHRWRPGTCQRAAASSRRLARGGGDGDAAPHAARQPIDVAGRLQKRASSGACRVQNAAARF
jgi:hypothetical protein